MSQQRIGVWLVGAHGGIATTVAVGLAALKRGLVDEAGLVSALDRFRGLDLVPWSSLVLGGHEIRETTAAAEAAVLHSKSRVFGDDLLDVVEEELALLDAEVRPGTLTNVGKTIAKFGGPKVQALADEAPVATIARLRQDIETFRSSLGLTHVVVVNVSSTEPPLATPAGEKPLTERTWAELAAALAQSTAANCPVPASTLSAIAAMEAGADYVNFTPSVGSDLPALDELARAKQVLHVGRDGKTGETLMKAVLAPMFAARNLNVMSWVGHNIFGNMDGKVLDDPINKANKVRSKDHLLTEILGYKPTTLVTIEYIEDMADWKTAWDHIHFKGFLDTKMTLQFTWQGCDSLLAAPLVLDLVRFTERARRAGECGVPKQLSSFFKSPMGADVPPEFGKQYDLLEKWAAAASPQGKSQK
jgi:myo-inositol-1-phosphate synthase